ncbi:MAG: NUDIX domain-containing protein [Bacteroidia bacterium]
MSHLSDAILPSLSIDCVLFGFSGADLNVLLIQRRVEPEAGRWALPGGFILAQEDLETASRRVLREMTGVEHLYLEQFQTFGRADRYPLRRVLTVAYYALVRPELYPLHPGPDAGAAQWFPLRAAPPLPFDHDEIVAGAFATLQRRVRHQPVGFELLPEKFTLHQLQRLYEAILETKLDKPNFRRKLAHMQLLIALDEYQQDVAHRAARLYRFDTWRYERLCQEGFVFEVSAPRERKIPDR